MSVRPSRNDEARLPKKRDESGETAYQHHEADRKADRRHSRAKIFRVGAELETGDRYADVTNLQPHEQENE